MARVEGVPVLQLGRRGAATPTPTSSARRRDRASRSSISRTSPERAPSREPQAVRAGARGVPRQRGLRDRRRQRAGRAPGPLRGRPTWPASSPSTSPTRRRGGGRDVLQLVRPRHLGGRAARLAGVGLPFGQRTRARSSSTGPATRSGSSISPSRTRRSSSPSSSTSAWATRTRAGSRRTATTSSAWTSSTSATPARTPRCAWWTCTTGRTPSSRRRGSGRTRRIEHNGYAIGDKYYFSNYERGLTILDVTNPLAPDRAGLVDTYPATDTANFHGAWAVYPFLPSGNILVSNIDGAGGLYVLRQQSPTSTVSPTVPRAPSSRSTHAVVLRVDGARPHSVNCPARLSRADVAQSVEQRFRKPQVTGSSPVVGSTRSIS